MAQTASDFLIDRLYDWGVRIIFGYPGDGINGVMGALNRGKDKIRFVQARHEESAAFMACGYAKFTGDVGVCIATSGPGAIHLLNGLYDAKMDHQPVVAIVGQQATMALGTDFQQEVDLISLFKDVAHEYVQMASSPEQMRQLIDRAMRIAKSDRTVTCIILPNDIQVMDAVTSPERKHGVNYTGLGHSSPNIIPPESELRRAAEILNAGQRVAMLVGAGALNATDEVIEVANRLGAGIAKALLGKTAVPDDIPYVTGPIGLLGSEPSWNMMMHCDTLLMVGSSFPYSEFLPKEDQAKGIQIDINPRNLSLRFPMEVNLRGDSALTLRALLPFLQRKDDRDWQDVIIKDVEDWNKLLEMQSTVDASPINPAKLFWELSSRLPDDCIITCDSGTAAYWYARDLKTRRGMMASVSGGLASMGCAVPYALAAKFAHPDRPVVATVGDGAMQMLGINGLISIAKYWNEWADPRLVILVLKNHDLNMVTWEQRVFNGDPKFPGSQDLPDMPYARYAELLGLRGFEVVKPEQIADIYDQLFQIDRPVVIDALCDPDVPPMPPHISLHQAKGYMFSTFKGDPNTAGVVKQTVKDVMSKILAKTKTG